MQGPRRAIPPPLPPQGSKPVRRRQLPPTMACAALAFAGSAAASCGSEFCILNTQWDTQGMTTQSGRFMADLRYEYIKQDELRRGTHKASLAEDTGDTGELKTLNRNLVASLDYTFDRHWGVAVALPVVKRDHSHLEDSTGAAALETWDFTRTGDARILGRYQFETTEATDNYGLQFGLKLPTGSHRVANGEGLVAERALQPGTGTTDAVVGAYYAYRPQFRGLGWFGQLLYQRAFDSRDGFKPGSQLSLSAGINYPASDRVTLLFQLNGLQKGRDTGENAEPELSGGRYLYASPGISFSVTSDTQVYAFVQQPLVRDVNGIQLTAKRVLVAGVSLRF